MHWFSLFFSHFLAYLIYIAYICHRTYKAGDYDILTYIHIHLSGYSQGSSDSWRLILSRNMLFIPTYIIHKIRLHHEKRLVFFAVYEVFCEKRGINRKEWIFNLKILW